MWAAVLELGRSMGWAHNQRFPCHEPVTWLHLSDLQNCGPCCTFRHSGQCHCQLIVTFNMLVANSVTTISRRLGRPECPIRDLRYQFPSLVHWINISQPCKLSHARTPRMMCRPTTFSGRVALRPSGAVDFLLHRSVSCSCSQWRVGRVLR